MILFTIMGFGYVVLSVIYTKTLLHLRALERKLAAIKLAADKAVYIGSDKHPVDMSEQFIELFDAMKELLTVAHKQTR